MQCATGADPIPAAGAGLPRAVGLIRRCDSARCRHCCDNCRACRAESLLGSPKAANASRQQRRADLYSCLASVIRVGGCDCLLPGGVSPRFQGNQFLERRQILFGRLQTADHRPAAAGKLGVQLLPFGFRLLAAATGAWLVVFGRNPSARRGIFPKDIFPTPPPRCRPDPKRPRPNLSSR